MSEQTKGAFMLVFLIAFFLFGLYGAIGMVGEGFQAMADIKRQEAAR